MIGVNTDVAGNGERLGDDIAGRQVGIIQQGGGGGLGGLFGGIGSILGFSNGGVVPHKPGFSKLGVDSVPAMLQPGEVVIPTDEVDNVLNRGSGSVTINNNITGDIDRQTRKVALSVIPELAAGINSFNRENGGF